MARLVRVLPLKGGNLLESTSPSAHLSFDVLLEEYEVRGIPLDRLMDLQKALDL